MSDLLLILLAGIFLPLFPLSMLFNAVLDRIKHSALRTLLFMVWPLLGLFILGNRHFDLPDWVIVLALLTSLLYALRMLALRDVNQWNGFLATSLWGLLWLAISQDNTSQLLYGYAIGMSIPLVLLVLLSAGLEQRYGAAYTGLYGGLARTIPRFAGVLVIVIVAAVATPLFPAFFFMFAMVVAMIAAKPLVSLILLLIWLLWSWAGARLIQGLVVGRASQAKIEDMNHSVLILYSMALVALLVAGIYLSGMSL